MADVIELKTPVQRTKEDVIATLEEALQIVRETGDYVGIALAMVRETGKVTVLRSKTENQAGLLGAIEYLKYRALLRLDENCFGDEEAED